MRSGFFLSFGIPLKIIFRALSVILSLLLILQAEESQAQNRDQQTRITRPTNSQKQQNESTITLTPARRAPARTEATPAVQPLHGFQAASRAIGIIELLHTSSGRTEIHGQGFFISSNLFVSHAQNVEPMLIRSREYAITLKGQGFSYPATIETLNLPFGLALLRTQFSHPHHIKLASSRQEDHFYPSLALALDEKLRGTLITQVSPQSIGAPLVYSDFTLAGLRGPSLPRSLPLPPGLLNRFLTGYLQQADRQVASLSAWEPALERMILDRQSELVQEATREPLTLFSKGNTQFARGLQQFRCDSLSHHLGNRLDCVLNSSLYSGNQISLGEVRILAVPNELSREPLSSARAEASQLSRPVCKKHRVHESSTKLDIEVCTAALPSLPRIKFVELKLRHQNHDLMVQLNGFDRAAVQRLIRYYTQVLGRIT